MLYESHSYGETGAIAESLARDATPGDIFCLTGDLGSGKTVFAKGFAQGLGISELITSPTFTLMNIYEREDGLPFYHFDMYRIESVQEMEDSGCEEYFYGEGVCLIEWADQIREMIPRQALWIHIEKEPAKGQDYRLIRIYTGDEDHDSISN